MFSKLNKWLNMLEDPVHPCLGQLLRIMTSIGLWHPNLKPLKPRLKLIFFYVVIAFFFSQYLKCVVSYNSDSFQHILRYAPFHMGVIKTCSFQKNYKVWEDLIGYISSVERNQIIEKDDDIKKIMSGYIRWSRTVTYFFYTLGIVTTIGIFYEPYLQNQVTENGTVYHYMFDSFTPFRREPPGYYVTMFMQTVLGSMMSIYIITWDLIMISIMIFFSGQLRMSSLYCSRVIDLETPENSQRNIVRCHEFHTNLVLYQKKFNALVSSVMFFYLVIISVNLGVCITQIAGLKDDLPTLLSSCLFIVACLVQLLLIYWHTNEVTVESERVSYSILKSDWIDADFKLRRQVILLAWTTSTRLIFKAGPFNEMTLTTFISILRRSYSFYTLMNGTK